MNLNIKGVAQGLNSANPGVVGLKPQISNPEPQPPKPPQLSDSELTLRYKHHSFDI